MAQPTLSGIPPRSAIVGRYAECSIGGVVLVLLFDWEVNVNFDYADVTAHGDNWKFKAFLDADWTARARGYIPPNASGVINTYLRSATLAGATGKPVALTFAGWDGPTGGGSAAKLWEGPCTISRGRLTAPMAMAEQEFELISNGIPTAGVAP